MEQIYLAFVDTPGFFASIIRRVIGIPYVHVVLSMDADLREAYSVGRRNPAVPLIAGFEKENTLEIEAVFPHAKYKVVRMQCTAEQKKSIARQLSLVSGTIYLDKSDVVTMNGNEFAKKMAVVLTDKLKTELMTCYDVVATGRYPYTGRFGVLSDEDKKAVDEAMELVNVSQIKDKDFTKISDGQRQRVMLSRAICQQPEIIVLDEPTSYLDIKYKLEFLSILQRLKRQKNLTVIMSLHELDMAKRVSDHILCIDGRYVDRYGTPEEVFTDQYVSGLFGITAGSFDETGEDLELEKPDGRARIFVIAGGGLGRKSFRSLQRKGIPFATGIIYENDLDYPAAKALSAEIVSARSFEPVDDALIEKAKELIDACEGVICDRTEFGTYEQFNSRLYEYAVSTGKIIKIPFHEEQLAQL